MKELVIENLKLEWTEALAEFFEQTNLKTNSLVVVGCSTSEVRGSKIGSDSNQDIGNLLFLLLMEAAQKNEVNLAIQCCEHLNRSLVIERNIAKKLMYPEVNAKPTLHAGGAFAVAAFQNMTDPILVENIQADAGIDIGDTFIGMHLKPVAVPLRLKVKQIGEAHLTSALTRPKLIGGARAEYRTDI
ncbi:MAG: TIGR01440 family protein [Clostridiaceae bacterium]|nr:TIGR01440 family protein [Clostridiaceae bacterium]